MKRVFLNWFEGVLLQKNEQPIVVETNLEELARAQGAVEYPKILGEETGWVAIPVEHLEVLIEQGQLDGELDEYDDC